MKREYKNKIRGKKRRERGSKKRDLANVADAQAQLATANYMLSHSKLEAPFDAIILSVYVNQGQYINNSLQGMTLISVARQGQYLTRFNVPLARLDTIKIDQPVTIKVAGKAYPGKISSIDFRTVDGSEGEGAAVACCGGRREHGVESVCGVGGCVELP